MLFASMAEDLRLKNLSERERGWLRQDIGEIARLMQQLAVEEEADYNCSYTIERQIAWLKRNFNDAWHYFQVIRVGSQLVACAGLARSRVAGIDGHLHSVYVEPAFRGYGFGRRVCQGVILQARNLKMTSLEMPRSANPLAVRLYESLGFESFEYQGDAHMALLLI